MKQFTKFLFTAALLLCTGVAFSQDDGEEAPTTDLVARYEPLPTATASAVATRVCTTPELQVMVTCSGVLAYCDFAITTLTAPAEYPATTVTVATVPAVATATCSLFLPQASVEPHSNTSTHAVARNHPLKLC